MRDFAFPTAPSAATFTSADTLPPRAPRAMPVSALHRDGGVVACGPTQSGVRDARIAFVVLTLSLAAAMVATLAHALEPARAGVAGVVAILALFTLNALWLSAAAASALLGAGAARRLAQPAPGWTPRGRTALLCLVCGEDPAMIATNLRVMRRELLRAGLLGKHGDIFVLSDTRDPGAIAAEERALSELIRLPGIHYRRRHDNAGRKPGNIRDWMQSWGGHYDYMLVMDADSRMSGARVRELVHHMERRPRLGLLQTGTRPLPGGSRLTELQRLSARLAGLTAINGLARITGDAGNFWGHNALLRTRAFAEAGGLPRLSGPAPMGGDLLSHDFVEAAWLRRAGWAVEIAPEARGSFEEGPADMADFRARDRRWCQGNMQHLRLLGARGLHPVNRLMLASGVLMYLAAPVWLALVLMLMLELVSIASAMPFLVSIGVLLSPKAAAMARWMRGQGLRRRQVVARAALRELWQSALIAPILMLRQIQAVGAVALGHDCGWKERPRSTLARLPAGTLESFAGLAMMALMLAQHPPHALPWAAPVLVPLIAAPWVIRWIDRPARG